MGELQRQGFTLLTVSILVISCAMAYAWVSPVLSELKDPEGELKATDDQISWIAVCIEFGTLTTPVLAGYLMDKFGRKKPMLGCVPAMVLSWGLTLKTRSVTILYIKRFIEGMVLGIAIPIGPIYIAEISTTRTRGAMMVLIVVSWNVGTILQFCIGTYLSYNTTALINMIIPIVYFIAFLFLPESPYYLVKKHRHSEAAKSLGWFRDKQSHDVSEEMSLIGEYLKEDHKNRKSFKEVVKNKTYRKCLAIMIMVMLANNMTGFTTLFSYATDMFAETGSEGYFNADTCSLIVVFQLFFISIIISFIIDKIGRRPLILLSGYGCFVSHVGSTIYFFFKDDIKCNWIPLVTIGLYYFFVSIGLFPIFTIFQGELFPSSIKSSASSLCVILNTSLSLVALKLYYIINVTFGTQYNYLLYALVAGLTTVWLCMYAPETKNKTFNEIFNELQGSSKKDGSEELQTL